MSVPSTWLSWLISSNTTTSLPYIIHPCCKQKAGKLSKQNNFLPEDKLLRTSAQILIPIHPVLWTELLSNWSQQKSKTQGFTPLVQLVHSWYTS